jgi:hypothetical protein
MDSIIQHCYEARQFLFGVKKKSVSNVRKIAAKFLAKRVLRCYFNNYKSIEEFFDEGWEEPEGI